MRSLDRRAKMGYSRGKSSFCAFVRFDKTSLDIRADIVTTNKAFVSSRQGGRNPRHCSFVIFGKDIPF